MDEKAIAALAPCPNLQCGRIIGIAYYPFDPSCQVFCAYCKCEVEFVNPYWEEEPISPDELGDPG